MAGNKDPAIKLFGKTIQLNSDSNIHASKFKPSAVAAATTAADSGCTPSVQNKNVLCSKQGENRAQEKFSKELPRSSKIEDEGSSSSIIEDYKTPPSPSTTVENTKKEDHSDQMSSTRSQDQTPPKKPDRILPCPRCNSMNTKFCYFNNYNVNQPRHFCKNCQRYWTAGGTMRNVPVGAGRRKNKNSSSSASHPRPFVIPEPQTGLIQHVLRPNGAILAFEPNLPLSKPMVSTLSHGEKPPLYWESKVSMFPNQAQPTWASSGIWNIQWVPTPNSYLDQSPSTASSNSLALGKHDRNGTLLKVCDSNKESGEKQSALVTKTIKIDDPTKTAKSSIWDTLGIRSEKVVNSSNNEGFFGGFGQSKVVVDHDWKNSSIEGSCMVLQANPAAFSRSLAFHESAQSSC